MQVSAERSFRNKELFLLLDFSEQMQMIDIVESITSAAVDLADLWAGTAGSFNHVVQVPY